MTQNDSFLAEQKDSFRYLNIEIFSHEPVQECNRDFQKPKIMTNRRKYLIQKEKNPHFGT